MDKDYEKIFALKPIVPDTNQRNTRVFKKETVEKWKKLAKKQREQNKKKRNTSDLGGYKHTRHIARPPCMTLKTGQKLRKTKIW